MNFTGDLGLLRGLQLRKIRVLQAQIRYILKRALREFGTEFKTVNKLTGYRLPISADGRMFLQRLADSLIEGAETQVWNLLEKSMTDASIRELKGVVKELQKQGRDISLNTLLPGVSGMAVALLNAKHPATGRSPRQVIRLAATRWQRQTRKVISARTRPDREKEFSSLVGSVLKNRSHKGSSVEVEYARLSRSEHGRVMRETVLSAARDLGIEFAYWRLSAAHPHYRHQEICEVYASSTGIGVYDALSQLKIPSRWVDTEGLYLVSDYPDIPHPNCLCGPELWDPSSVFT